MNSVATREPANTASESRTELTAITRQHEGAVYTYLWRRLRPSVNVGELTHDVFYRFYTSGGLDLPRSTVRARLLKIARELLDAFVRDGNPADQVAWTELCLELDDLVASRRATAE